MDELIVWDERKRLANVDKHGLDFAEIEGGFDFDGAVIFVSRAKRFKAIGSLHGKAVAVVFARLGTEAISIICLRPASKQERRAIHA
jgi:uncharacterized protein